MVNLENGGFGATGQNVTAVVNLATKAASVFFFTDADLNSSNAILTAPLSALGLTQTSQFHFSVQAIDNYFTTGKVTDSIENMTFSFAQPRFVASSIQPLECQSMAVRCSQSTQYLAVTRLRPRKLAYSYSTAMPRRTAKLKRFGSKATIEATTSELYTNRGR